MSKILDSLELKLRRILEGSLDGLFFPNSAQSLSAQLTEIILKAVRTSLDETDVLPDFIQLRVSPEKYDAWLCTQPVLDKVSQEIMDAFKDASVQFEKPLRLHLLADDSLGVDELKVIPSQNTPEQITTATVINLSPDKPAQSALPEQACLIIDGHDPIMLSTAIVSIGRHSSNDIVVQDPQVSRKHLQLRAEKGSYLLFDLSSTGGTFINNKPVSSAKLKPGDVIRIGKTLLIYSHDQEKKGTGTRVLSQMGGNEE
ncbi:MAG TPA: FHA domain-containing protein [Anaerolineaceae bacterium]|nr:FHA domain-containing protein [Anaerolineaceae bacterium]